MNDLRNSNSLSNNTIQKIFKDKAGNLWFGTSGGLNRLNPATGMFTRFQHDPGNKETLSGNFIASLYEDRESNFWISTFDKGLNLMDRRTGKFTRYQHSADDTSSLTSDNVSCIFEDQPNMLWIGTWTGGGINIMNSKTGKIKHYLSDQNIVAFFKDADGIIWIGSESGLFRYNRQSNDFTTIDEENVGFNINNVRSIIGDNKNNLWVGTFSGIFKINPRRDMAIFYGKESGIRTQNLYYNSVYKGQDGTLFFGGYSGYYAFYPDKLKISPSVPKMDFTNFWLNGQLIKADKNGPLQEPLFMAKEIYLKYDQNVFSFSFSATDYGKLEDKQIAVGIITFIKRDYLEYHDIGFAFLPAYAKQGYAFEAALAVLTNLVKDKEHSTILATTIKENEASIQLLKKLGFTYRNEIKNGNDLLHVYSVNEARLNIPG